jgi:hypothetical protein
MSAPFVGTHALAGRFRELQHKSVDEQAAFFGRRFVFTLGENFGEVYKLATAFKAALPGDANAKNGMLSPAGAAGLLQHLGKTHTAQQRKAALHDVDVDANGMLSCAEFLLINYKITVLKEHFARLGEPVPSGVDVAGDGIGVLGYGSVLVEELFSVPQGVDADLEKAMHDYQVEHEKNEAKIKSLQEKVAKGGVAGLAAKNELEQLKQVDQTGLHAVEARIQAAIKKALLKTTRELEAKKKHEEDEKKAKLAAGRSALADKAAAFTKRVSQRLTGSAPSTA